MAATVAFYQAAMMHEALETDQTRELQFGIGNYDVQMMIVIMIPSHFAAKSLLLTEV